MIFAAGLGTRLRPLTNDRPKALVEVHGKTLLQHAIEHLKSFGITTIVINIHYFGQTVLDFLAEQQNFGCELIISDERTALLETGGGLKKAAQHLVGEEAIILYNVDILSNIDLNKMLHYHQQQQALATLATRTRDSSRYLLFNKELILCGWQNIKTGVVKDVRTATSTTGYAFSGIQIISPKFLNLITQEGKFSIMTTYLDLAKQHKIVAYPHDEDYWFDVGTTQKLAKATDFLAQNNSIS